MVGKVVNIAARCAAFINKRFDSQLSELPDPALYQEFSAASGPIAELYESRRYNQAIREIMALADKANFYIDEYKPWVLTNQMRPCRRCKRFVRARFKYVSCLNGVFKTCYAAIGG